MSGTVGDLSFLWGRTSAGHKLVRYGALWCGIRSQEARGSKTDHCFGIKGSAGDLEAIKPGRSASQARHCVDLAPREKLSRRRLPQAVRTHRLRFSGGGTRIAARRLAKRASRSVAISCGRSLGSATPASSCTSLSR